MGEVPRKAFTEPSAWHPRPREQLLSFSSWALGGGRYEPGCCDAVTRAQSVGSNADRVCWSIADGHRGLALGLEGPDRRGPQGPCQEGS